MNVTITFLFQIVHFYLLYFFLDRFLLYPLYSTLKENTLSFERIHNQQQAKEHEIDALEEHKQAQLVDFQAYMAEAYKEPVAPVAVIAHLERREIAQDTIIQAQKDICQAVLESVHNAY